jgi:N-acetylneuraminic acid mutarotase
MSSSGVVPSARGGHTAVWTGSKMIVWGGGSYTYSAYRNDGGIYDPATGLWTAMSTIGAPTARYGHVAVWTGSRMIVWGGMTYYQTYVNDGAAYDPTTDSWTPISRTNAPEGRSGATAVWSTGGMIVWGGEAASGHPTDLYIYK